MRLLAAIAAASIVYPVLASAQLVPNARWYTIETKHFRVHFTRGLESEGRRGAADAERAFAELSTELKPPRGKVDLVIADNIDYVNGYATTFPSNRIVVYAHPPFDSPDLRNYDDWLRLVITHELTHIFHLDRADGLWRLGRDIFGRHPAFFPNSYQPAWLVEGLAVYYESRITGAGRLEGSEHYMLARAAAEANRVPRIGELSRATTRFPGGETVYAYGSLIWDYLARTRGADKIPKFVDKTSRLIWPVSLNARAKSVFGISFENAWRDWRDSLVRTSAHREPAAGWKDLTREGRYVVSPRWLNDTTLIYSASTGKDVPSAYTVTLSGAVKRIARRNGLDANAVSPDGSIVFAQPDYVDAFHYRTDLWVHRNGHDVRLTRGARISQPDVRADGKIVGVQAIPGSSRLVVVSADGKSIVPVTSGDLTTQWTEPRWSPDGKRIAAVRITSTGLSKVVVIDPARSSEDQIAAQRTILSTPSWDAAHDAVLFTSNSSGITQAYRAPSTGLLYQVTHSSTGFFNPEISPDGKWLAGLSFRYDGYHAGVAPAPPLGMPQAMEKHSPREGCASCFMSVHPAVLADTEVPSPHRYSPWRSLVPTYWEPVLTQSTGTGSAYGAATSGQDIIGRHSYYLQAAYNTKFDELAGYGAYQYGGFGQPYLNFTAEQSFEHFGIFTTSARVGDLNRRERTGGISATFVRPRARTFSSLTVGGELESRTYTADPDTLLAHLSTVFQEKRDYPSVFASAGWNNAKRPSLSISREDGIALSTTARQRWRSGDIGSASRSIIGVAALYKSLDLPGFAHHVLAVRTAGGYAGNRAISTFSVGGLSGGSLDVLEGVAIGGERRTFGVRGFPPSAEQGIRAVAATAEYRAPLVAPSRRVPFVPVLFDRISASFFGEAGRAFCPGSAGSTEACRAPRTESPWLASTGAELDFDTALQYDVPARFRLGVAVPVLNRAFAGADKASIYLTIGSSF